MKMTTRNLTGALFIATAALGTAWTQSAAHEIRLSDIRAQQPEETIYASAPCQRARDSSRGFIWESYAIDPKTLVPDLHTLMDRSDEVVLAGLLDSAVFISPNGKSTAAYIEVRVIRRWKGPHHAGDVLTFGVPFGSVICTSTSPGDTPSDTPRFTTLPDDFGVPAPEPFSWIWVLFLRKSQGDETQWVQGLRPSAGSGAQGMFTIKVPPPTAEEPVTECSGNQWSWERCAAWLETSRIPVSIPYAHDPLGKAYGGMPTAEFLRQVGSIAAGPVLADTSSRK